MSQIDAKSEAVRMLTRSSGRGRWAILWGGGLGDVLVIRPLLQAFKESGYPRPVYMTTASHLPRLFDELNLAVQVLRLPRSPIRAIKQARLAGQLEGVYCGPLNTWRTHLLARTLRTERIWQSPKTLRNDFIGESIVQDMKAMRLSGFSLKAYGSLPLFPPAEDSSFCLPPSPYIVVHPAAKAAWEAKRWPDERWGEFLSLIARQGWHLHLVGVGAERGFLASLTPASAPANSVTVHTDLPLWALERLVAHAHGVICHNSGVMHVAAALKKPTLVLTGSSGRQWRAPYQWVLNVSSGACNLACNRYHCPIPGFRARCIKTLSVADVFSAYEVHIKSKI